MKNYMLSAYMLVAAGLPALAGTFTSGGLTYTTLSATTVEVAKPASSYSGDVVIPETVSDGEKSYTVTRIGDEAFCNNKDVTSIAMPNTITVIGTLGLAYINNVTHLTLSTSLETLETKALTGNTQITELVLPSSLRTIGDTSLSGLGCEEITVPEGVERISDYAFSNCAKLKKIFLPASITRFDSAVFTDCPNLDQVVLAEGSSYMSLINGILYSHNSTQLRFCPVNYQGPVEMGPLCYGVGVESFKNCKGVTEITCPRSAVRFGRGAFMNCGMTEIHLAPQLELIGAECFQGCSNIKHLNIPLKPADLLIYNQPGYNFADMTSLEEITLPDVVTGQLGNCIFQNDKSLRKITVGPKVTAFGVNSFKGCEALDTLFLKAVKPAPFKLLDGTVGDPGFSQENYDHVVVMVPSSALRAYSKDEVWNRFKNLRTDREAPNEYGAKITSLVGGSAVAWEPTIDLTFEVENTGRQPITSLTGVLTIDGEDYPAQTISGLAIRSCSSDDVTISLPLDMATYALQLHITEVNGQPNEDTESVFTCSLQVFDGNIPEGLPEASYADFRETDLLGATGAKMLESAIKFVDPNLVGCKVIGAKVIGLPAESIANVKLWNSKSLSHNPTGGFYPVEVKDGVAVARFASPVTLTSQGAFFGIKMDIVDNGELALVLPVSGPKKVANSFFYSIDGGAYSNGAINYGALQLVLIFDKDGFPAPAVLPATAGSTEATVVGQSITVPVKIINYSGQELTKLTYTYSGDGQTHQGTITDKLLPLATVKQTVNVPLEGIEVAGNYNLKLQISGYNDNVNTWSDKSVTIPICVGSFATTNRAIMEENTGLQCGYCPRGTLGMTELGKRFPEFVGAAYHAYALSSSTDPMRPSLTPPIAYDAAPQCQINRSSTVIDPFSGSNGQPMGIADAYSEAMIPLAPADLGLETSWNADSTEIKATATAKFSFVPSGKSYKIGYLLTIDNVLSPGTGQWLQNNYYAGSGESNPLLQTLCDGTFPLNVYNHVVIDMAAARGSYNCDAPEPDKVFTDDHIFKIADVTLEEPDWLDDAEICHRSDIHVIALLIDNKGNICNAIEVAAREKTGAATSVSDVAMDVNSPVSYYDLMGRRVMNPQHGIFIKVQGNRSTKVAL